MGKVTYTINTALVKDMTIGDVFSLASKIERGGGAAKQGIDRDLGFAAQFVRNDLLRYRFSNKGIQIKVEDFYRMRQIVCEDYVHIHRMSYITYYLAENTAGWMEDLGMLTFNVKKYWKTAERIFAGYKEAHKSMLEPAVWKTLQDNMRLLYDLLHPNLDAFEVAIRDYLIQKRSVIQSSGQKDDIALLTKVYVVILFCAALRNTRRNFFKSQYEKVGIDLSSDFAYADIDGMFLNFVRMMTAAGVSFCKDDDGDDIPVGVVISKSVRVEAEWNKIVRIVTDADLMDETALAAINNNPETKADYEALMERRRAKEREEDAKREQQELDEAMERLREIANVKRS